MASPTSATSPLIYARVAGYGYLIVFVFGIFSSFIAIDSLIVLGDTATTADNIIGSEFLFRLGIASGLIVLVADTVVAWALYVLLRPANSALSLLATLFRLVFVAIFAVNQINLFVVLQIARGTDHARITLFLDAFNFGTHIGWLFFGIHIAVLGYLVLKSSFIPRIIGGLLIVASVGYFIDTFANFLSSDYAENEIAFILILAVPAIIAELSLTLWLLLKGVNVERWRARALESA